MSKKAVPLHPISKERQCPCGHLAASCALKKTQSRVPSLSMECAFFIYCLFKANFSTKANMQINRVCQFFDTPYFRYFVTFYPNPTIRTILYACSEKVLYFSDMCKYFLPKLFFNTSFRILV